jgi:cytochrome c oxidase subunit 2
MIVVATIVYVIVIGALLLIMRRRDPSQDPLDPAREARVRRTITISVATTAVILFVLLVYDFTVGRGLMHADESSFLSIQVTGRQWWWDVEYEDPIPQNRLHLANEIHIPVGRPVRIKLVAHDVIHSFWVPELHGKMDLIPTRINNITLQADQVGVYRGQCAEFCGLQHAHMGFMVVVQSKDDFNKWLSAQQQPAAAPNDPSAVQGQQVFMNTGCVFCHTVKGLDDKEIDRSSIDLGPDLTHIASRLTIAGASVAENRGNLAGWIVDAQHVKPGSLMPNMYLNSQDLQNLLAYLETLH